MTLAYIYPNEHHWVWSLLIVLYPFLTGIVAGSLAVSILARAFRIKALLPFVRLALRCSLSFLLLVPLPLLLHLQRPWRGLQILWTPQVASPMAWFGYVYTLLLALLLLLLWLEHRSSLLERYHLHRQQQHPRRQMFYSLLLLGSLQQSDQLDDLTIRWSRFFHWLSLPLVVLLTGYMGFIFASIRANPWWATPLKPLIFLASALVSGLSVVILSHALSRRWHARPRNNLALASLHRWLLGFLLLEFSLEILGLLHHLTSPHPQLSLLYQRLSLSLLLQLALGTILPLLLLLWGLTRSNQYLPRRWQRLLLAAAALSLPGVFALRWNVVIGGQLLSKSGRGFLSFLPSLAGREGILLLCALLLLPLLLQIFLGALFREKTSSPLT